MSIKYQIFTVSLKPRSPMLWSEVNPGCLQRFQMVKSSLTATPHIVLTDSPLRMAEEFLSSYGITLSHRNNHSSELTELIWVKLEVIGTHPLFISAYYRPKEDDQASLLELHKSVENVRKKAKGNIWLLGDFNFPKFTWLENQPNMNPDCSHKQTYNLFHDFLDDFSFTQIVKEPTRYNNILDLFLTTNPTLIKSLACLPGLSDHDMVIAECALKPTPLKQKPRKAQLLRKADWPRLKSLLSDY